MVPIPELLPPPSWGRAGWGCKAALAALALVALAGCDVVDADRGQDSWRPKGLNAANLAAMVQNPADLVQGRHDTGPDRKFGARAVTDLWANPRTTLNQGGGSGSGATPSAMQALAPGGGSEAGGGASAGAGASGAGN